MKEFDSLYDLTINYMFWFLLGTMAAYAFFTLLEYIDGQNNKD